MLEGAYKKGASDLVLTAGHTPQIKLHGKLISLADDVIRPDDLASLVEALLTEDQQAQLHRSYSVDFSRGYPGLSRFRFHVFRQRGSFALVARVIPHEIPRLDTLGLPSGVMQTFTGQPSGLVLFTGPTGSGKSTSMAAIIQHINETRSSHVVCLEDPIEFLHHHGRCTIEQREIGTDALSFSDALRDVFRETPDVIMVGEMRDWETIGLALTLAETGHLVFGTLHTHDAVQAVSRIVHSFPMEHQEQAYLQLSSVLNGIVAQQLIPLTGRDGRVLCCEVLIATHAVRNLIREHQQHQIYSVLQMGRDEGMCTMNEMLLDHIHTGKVSQEVALSCTTQPKELLRMLNGSSLKEGM